jgi:hypothetical protein
VQEDISNATRLMQRELEDSVIRDASGQGSWRYQDALFSATLNDVPSGCINVSPAWFQQGHEVGDHSVLGNRLHEHVQ